MKYFILSFLIFTTLPVFAEPQATAAFRMKPGIYDNLSSKSNCSWRVDYLVNKLNLSAVNRYDGTKCPGSENVTLDCRVVAGGQSARCCGGYSNIDANGVKRCDYIYTAYASDVVDTTDNVPERNFGLLRWVAESSPRPSKFVNSARRGWSIVFPAKYCTFKNGTKIDCDDLDDTLLEPECEGLEQMATEDAQHACKAEGYKKCETIGATREFIYKLPIKTLTKFTGCRSIATVIGSE